MQENSEDFKPVVIYHTDAGQEPVARALRTEDLPAFQKKLEDALDEVSRILEPFDIPFVFESILHSATVGVDDAVQLSHTYLGRSNMDPHHAFQLYEGKSLEEIRVSEQMVRLVVLTDRCQHVMDQKNIEKLLEEVSK